MTTAAIAPPSESGAITFVDGLPGFETCRRYLLAASPALDPFTCVHGIGDGAPAFLAIDPRQVVDDYCCDLTTLERMKLEAEPGVPLLWLAIVNGAGAGKPTVNLRAPIVINPGTMRGLQLLGGDPSYSIDHPLGD
jgi:flagellar assembly factor FliW